MELKVDPSNTMGECLLFSPSILFVDLFPSIISSIFLFYLTYSPVLSPFLTPCVFSDRHYFGSAHPPHPSNYTWWFCFSPSKQRQNPARAWHELAIVYVYIIIISTTLVVIRSYIWGSHNGNFENTVKACQLFLGFPSTIKLETYVTPKHQWTCTILHNIMSHKMVVFIIVECLTLRTLCSRWLKVSDYICSKF
jgi:hypothetical protein